MSDLAKTLARKNAAAGAKKSPAGHTSEKSTGSAGGRWDENHRRASFYLSNDLIEDLDDAVTKHGMTKSQIVTAALNAWLEE